MKIILEVCSVDQPLIIRLYHSGTCNIIREDQIPDDIKEVQGRLFIDKTSTRSTVMTTLAKINRWHNRVCPQVPLTYELNGSWEYIKKAFYAYEHDIIVSSLKLTLDNVVDQLNFTDEVHLKNLRIQIGDPDKGDINADKVVEYPRMDLILPTKLTQLQIHSSKMVSININALPESIKHFTYNLYFNAHTDAILLNMDDINSEKSTTWNDLEHLEILCWKYNKNLATCVQNILNKCYDKVRYLHITTPKINFRHIYSNARNVLIAYGQLKYADDLMKHFPVVKILTLDTVELPSKVEIDHKKLKCFTTYDINTSFTFKCPELHCINVFGVEKSVKVEVPDPYNWKSIEPTEFNDSPNKYITLVHK